MIEFKNVSLSFNERTILNNINTQLTESRIGIVGSNGGGKSSFVRLINALLLPTTGSVYVEGNLTVQDKKQVRRDVGFVFQNPDHQIVMPTVFEDFCFGLKNQHLPKETIQAYAEYYLQRLGLWDLKDNPATCLSGGQKQLLAIAGVLAMQPKYIVFDEPTTLLDLRNRRMIKQILAELSQKLIVVSHDLDLLADFDRILVLDSGCIKFDGQPTEAIAFYEALMQ